MEDPEKYKVRYAFAEDYGTSMYKYGPVREYPDVIENRGLILEPSLIQRVFAKEAGGELKGKRIIVGEEVAMYLGSRDDMAKNLIYPMRDGIIDLRDEIGWRIVEEITRYGLRKYRPKGDQNFKGFYVAASLSATAPKYMYEKIFEIHKKIDEEEGLVKAITIIPQPLAVAIAEKSVTCMVVESGHGNTQICPISRYPIRDAIVSLNRGGAEANAITAEILRDAGYGDLVPEERLVRLVKEAIGLIPLDLDKAIRKAKEDKERFRVIFRVPGTTMVIDLGDNSWTRFLIGEVIFNPGHEIFESYYKRGVPRPRDTIIGEERVTGTISLADAIIKAAEKCPLELHEYLWRRVILSGGNFAWKVPKELRDVACDAATKVRKMLEDKGLKVHVGLVKDPQYSVWKGALTYALAVPENYSWDWKLMEGWYKWR
ncbi:MAG: hypothetical protein B6U69_03165 [Thermofilum sp. ex4484_15]|nr:MAG: hypothetical protein B6U69_03165 [Thermofilum sp. ex4484_15]